jgi:hypothetical protein
MSTLLRSALIALVLTGTTAVVAAPAHNYGWRDWSKPYGGFDPNSQEGQRAYWDYQSQHGN